MKRGPYRTYTAPKDSERCRATVILRDGSGAACMHRRKAGSEFCRQHEPESRRKPVDTNIRLPDDWIPYIAQICDGKQNHWIRQQILNELQRQFPKVEFTPNPTQGQGGGRPWPKKAKKKKQ